MRQKLSPTNRGSNSKEIVLILNISHRFTIIINSLKTEVKFNYVGKNSAKCNFIYYNGKNLFQLLKCY